jgi:hypothetical protein
MNNDFNLDKDIWNYLRLRKLQEDTPHTLSIDDEMDLRKIVELYIDITFKTLNNEQFILLKSQDKKQRAINFINRKMNYKVELASTEFEKQLWEKVRTQIIEVINEMKLVDIHDGRD